MKFTAKMYALDFDLAGYMRVFLKALRDINERSGQAWITAAVDKTPIPTWSGASRATFQKLAAELGTSVPIGPQRSVKSRVGLGFNSASGSGVVEELRNGYVGFVYSTNLRYLAYNEYNLATAGPPPAPYTNNVRFTPYNFQFRAQTAWQRVARTAKLPNPYLHLKKRKL